MPLIDVLNDLLNDLLKKGPRGNRCHWVALSGGVDSVVLLHLLVSAQLSVPIKALHIHHGLSAYADEWQQHCETLCRELGVTLESVQVQVKNTGKGIEDAAREARYEVFEQRLAVGEVLLTAHHGDDQVETMLMRLMRGAGPRGLASMASTRPLGLGVLARPFLGVARSELESYAHNHGLRWIEDDSNTDRRFDRNYLRHEVIPAMRERWPGLVAAWGESAALCSDSEALLGELAVEDLERASIPGRSVRPTVGEVLNLDVLLQWSVPRRSNLLRYWIRGQGLPVPGREQLSEVNRQLIEGREDARARVVFGEWELRRFRRGLYLLRSRWLEEVPASSVRINWNPDVEPQLTLPEGARLSAERLVGKSDQKLLSTNLPELQVRWRQGGERCHPSDRAHSQTLKNLLQEHDLEPWWRGKLPLIYSGETLVAAGDLWVCRGFEAQPGMSGYRLLWRPVGSF